MAGNEGGSFFDRSTRPVYDRNAMHMDDATATSQRRKQNESGSNSQCRRLRALISYDGTNYAGFQTQPNGRTIQDMLETRLSVLLDARVHVAASGRTDAGVHARGQVVHFDIPQNAQEIGRRAAGHLKKALESGTSDAEIATMLERTLAADAWRVDGREKNGKNCRLPTDNGNLPADIQVLSISPASSPTFHARESCIGKRYVYTIQEGAGSPTTRRYRWKLGRDKQLNVEQMNEAAQRFIGERDFSTFGVIEDGDTRTPIKRMRRLEVSRIVTIDPIEAAAAGCINTDAVDGSTDTVVTITAECDRFLYSMMRMICGTLVQVGLGRLTPEDITALLNQRGRKGGKEAQGLEVTKAPAHGLCLHHCFYEPEESAVNWMGSVTDLGSNSEDDIQAALALLQL